jgi:C4-dicarboxylate transporter DctM subunit
MTSEHPAGTRQLDARQAPQVIAFLLFVNIVLLLAGNVMEPSSIVLIMAPILFPVAMKLIDPVHFGIMMTVNMEVGMPPAGGPEPLRRLGHRKMDHGIDDRRVAVAADHARFPGDRHLLAGISLWLPGA